MARKRAESMDQRSVWTVDAAGAPRKLRGSPMASSQPGGMLGFAPFRGFIRGMSADGLPKACKSSIGHRSDGAPALTITRASRRPEKCKLLRAAYGERKPK
jgi:hypothetical protein